ADQYCYRQPADEAGDARIGRAYQARGGRGQSRADGAAGGAGKADPLGARQTALGGRPRRNAPRPPTRTMIVVDSSVWIDYLNGRATAETDALYRLARARLVIGD